MIKSASNFRSKRNFFEMVRFDFVVDEDLNVYIMEVRQFKIPLLYYCMYSKLNCFIVTVKLSLSSSPIFITVYFLVINLSVTSCIFITQLLSTEITSLVLTVDWKCGHKSWYEILFFRQICLPTCPHNISLQTGYSMNKFSSTC